MAPFALILWIPAGLNAASAPTGLSADSLFAAGRFDEADSAWGARVAMQPADTSALLGRARVALWRNRTQEARTWLDRAKRAGATGPRVSSLEAESYYRDDRLDLATSSYEAAGRPVLARKLAALGRGAYIVRGPDQARLAFLQTDPLPVVELWVNGHGPLNFIIDTGGGELIVDASLADSLGARRYGEETGTYAADQRRSFEHGSVDSVSLGAMTVQGVPVHLLDTRRFSAAAGGRRVAGVLGTILLSRFRFTLDYPNGALLLERRPASPDSSAGGVEIPFWWAGDHLLLARGSYGSSGPLTWFLDTGLAGAAFTAPASTLREAGVVLRDTTGFTGQGGGGAVRVVPFRVDSLRLGPIEQGELMGMLGPFPTSLEYSLGTRVAGILSHAFLRSYRVRFDFDRMRLRLAPRD